MSQSEEWRAIPGFEGQYEASSLGRIACCARKVKCSRFGYRFYDRRIKKVAPSNDGYTRLTLVLDGKNHREYLHRLVALAFHGLPNEGMEVCHNDGDPKNNRPENLRWDTRSSNAADRGRHGTALLGGTATSFKTYCVRCSGNKKSFLSRTHEQITIGKKIRDKPLNNKGNFISKILEACKLKGKNSVKRTRSKAR